MQTTPELRLILTLEHLPAHDVLTGQREWTFGLVLSVASTTPLSNAQRALLRPWEWNFMNPNEGLHYQVVIDDVAGQVSSAPAPFQVPVFNGCPVDLRAHAINALQSELSQIPEDRVDDIEWEP